MVNGKWTEASASHFPFTIYHFPSSTAPEPPHSPAPRCSPPARKNCPRISRIDTNPDECNFFIREDSCDSWTTLTLSPCHLVTLSPCHLVIPYGATISPSCGSAMCAACT